jgi:hypothetical protein
MGLELIASLALAGIGAAVSAAGSINQGNAQKKAQTFQMRQQEIRAQQERTQAIREARIKRASIVQAGENQGAGESSSVAGGAASVDTQLSGNLSFINEQVRAGQEISKAQQDMANAQGISAVGAGISSLGGSIFNNRDEVTDIRKDIFG